MSLKYLADIEVFWEHFELSVENYETKEKKSFWCNQFRDDRKEMIKWLREYKGFMITFNGIRYDFAVLTYLDQNNYFINQTWDVFCSRAKEFSDQLINSNDELFVYQYIDKSFKSITHIDLMLFWAKMLRISKKISLKSLGIQLNYPVVQELPYNPDTKGMTLEMIKEINHYCSVHDLGILRMLTEVLENGDKGVPLGDLGTISLRSIIAQEYGINAWSMDAPKIASTALLQGYCRDTKQSEKVISKLRFNPPIIRFGDLFKDIDFGFVTPVIKQVYTEWMNSVNTFDKEFNIFSNNHGLKISVGIGGIHSVNKNQIYTQKKGYKIITSDVASLYPQFIINYKAFRFPEVLKTYSTFKEHRITQTKPNLKKYKGKPEEIYWKTIDAYYKVILNGTSGHLDSEHSWLFNREGIMKVRCGGQLVLLWVIDQCIQNNIVVLSCNTDGLEVYISEEQESIYFDIIKRSEEKFNLVFEHEEYLKIVFSSVNSYIAINTEGKIKQKGEFVTKPPLGNSTDFLIIPHLLNDYFVKGIKPEVAIKNYDDIFLFCASQKVDKSYQVIWGNEVQQRLNRYYVSRKGKYLYKKRDGKLSHLLKGYGVQLYNNHKEQEIKDYNIDYSYYLKEVNDMISNLENRNQLTLF